MAVFQIGDRVEVLDDTIKGVVVAIEGKEITVESTEGFPLTYMARELVRVSGKDEISVSNQEISRSKSEKEVPRKKKVRALGKKQRNAPKMEVDLHIGQLVKSSKGMSNHEMLNLQLETAKRQLEFAIRKRIQKVVFIHGVGAGVLKEELNYLFRRYDNVKYYDADYQKYGTGATEIYIYGNG